MGGIVAAGTYQPPDAATETLMYAALAQLRSEAAQAATTVYTTQSFSNSLSGWLVGVFSGTDSDNNGQEAAANSAGDLQARVETLGSQIQDVEAGEWSSAEFFAQASLLHTALAGLVSDVGDWSYSGVGTASLVATGQDVKTAVTAAVNAANVGLKFALSPWFWAALGVGVALYFFGPEVRALGRKVGS